jgi:ubiquinol-cytochrome c reductase cytochrome c1 subunit
MHIERAGQRLGCSSQCSGYLAWVLVVAAAFGASGAQAQEEGAAGWETWHANTTVADRASVQHGARNFVNFCLGCHSLQYERWSRLCSDLQIPSDVCKQDIVPVGDKDSDYIQTTMPAADAETWFGKTPPDLTLMARARGPNYLYQFLKTFYADSTRPTGANNLRLPATAMPAVLSDLEGLKVPVFKPVAKGQEPVFAGFQQIAPGRMSPEEYDVFVKDTVNFLDYVSEPTQQARRSTGIWVVLFLLVFTWIAWLMKREYWKDVH